MEIMVRQNFLQGPTFMCPFLLKIKKTALLFLLTTFLVLTTFAQNSIVVKGRITNEKSQPVPDASIVVKGNTAGTTSDNNGEFQVNAPANGTLVISSIGYPAKEILINGQAIHNVSLTTSSTDMEQVVVVGYGTQRKRDVTGAISKISSETLLQTASHNVIDQLKGQVAGVNVTSTSAVPGGGSQIRIRGNRTMVANTSPNNVQASTFSNEAATADQADAPLLVVDGIPYAGNLNDISPNDIA